MHQSCETLYRRFSDSPNNHHQQLQDDIPQSQHLNKFTCSSDEDDIRNSLEVSEKSQMGNVATENVDKESLLSKSESEPSLETDSLQDQNSNKNSTDTDSEILSLSISMEEMSDCEKKPEQLHIEFENFNTADTTDLGIQYISFNKLKGLKVANEDQMADRHDG